MCFLATGPDGIADYAEAQHRVITGHFQKAKRQQAFAQAAAPAHAPRFGNDRLDRIDNCCGRNSRIGLVPGLRRGARKDVVQFPVLDDLRHQPCC